ncbi:MAG: hypothetical protein AAF299_13000, partial [Pseudomonadota bacterium]
RPLIRNAPDLASLKDTSGPETALKYINYINNGTKFLRCAMLVYGEWEIAAISPPHLDVASVCCKNNVSDTK